MLRHVCAMLSLEQIRKIDPALADIPDAELEQIRDAYYAAAQLAFDVRAERKSGSKNPVRLLTETIVKSWIEVGKI